jgi:hypothetical protein
LSSFSRLIPPDPQLLHPSRFLFRFNRLCFHLLKYSYPAIPCTYRPHNRTFPRSAPPDSRQRSLFLHLFSIAEPAILALFAPPLHLPRFLAFSHPTFLCLTLSLIDDISRPNHQQQHRLSRRCMSSATGGRDPAVPVPFPAPTSTSQDPDDLMMSAMNAAASLPSPRSINNPTSGLLCLVYLALLFTVAACTQSPSDI